MLNAYISLDEIKAAMPGAIRGGNADYDAGLLRAAANISRLIDEECRRHFYPVLATRYFQGRGRCGIYIDDLISVTSVAYSEDDGATYTTLSASDYQLSVSGDRNAPGSHNFIAVHPNSTVLSYWPPYLDSVRIVGVWGYAADRANAWLATGDTVEDAPLSSSATTLTLNDVSRKDTYGFPREFSPGRLYRIESEYVEAGLAVDDAANTLGIVRGRNGSTAAQHVQDTAIDRWQVHPLALEACKIECIRHFQRGQQSYANARATAEIGELVFTGALDPSTRQMLNPLRNLEAV